MQNIIAGILALIFGFFGDIFNRVFFLNCSLNKAWSLFFIMPPLSIVTSILYFFNMIEPGVSCASLFDVFLIIIPVVTVLLSIILPKIMEQNSGGDTQSILFTVVLTTLYITLFTAARVYKYSKRCDKVSVDKTKGKPYGKIIMTGFLKSLAANLGILAFNWLCSVELLQFIPIIGKGFYLWDMIGQFSPGLQYAIPLTLAHFIFNAMENNEKDIKELCNS